MSETAAAEPAATLTETSDQSESSAQEIDWKAKSRMWEQRAKQNNDAAAKLAEIEESQKTEAQKLQEQLTALQERATTAERDKERLSVIAKHGIPEEYHDLVHGTDADSLSASAAKVKALITSTAGAQTAQSASFVIPDEGGSPNLALNGDGIEAALKNALGIR
jgi:hypothetical protein